MNQNLTAVDTIELVKQDVEAMTLYFVDDADYEFIGGGNAVNGF